jgi:hypothetical protein
VIDGTWTIAYGAIGPDASGVFRVSGNADQPYDFTLTDDVARYIAAVALDASAGRYVRVARDTRSPNELAARTCARPTRRRPPRSRHGERCGPAVAAR